MDTKKFNANGQGKAKAGRDNTRVILTAAGLAAAAAAGAGAGHIFSGKDNEVEPEKPTEEVTDDKVKPTEENKENETAQENAQENAAGSSATSSSATQDDISQPQPTTGNGTNSGASTQAGTSTQPQNPSHPQEPSHPTGGDTPQEVAEQIAHAEEIDKDDIDAPAMVEIDGFTTAYDQDGNEVAAVMTHTPDGTPLLLVDVDGDGVFEGVFDTNGNFVAQAEANLTHSDLEAMMDQTGGFLALNEHDKTTATEDPTNDIIDTETGTHTEMAMNDHPTDEPEPVGYSGEQPGMSEQPAVAQQEEPSADEIDNLLAELLGPGTDGESKGVSEEVLVDEYEDSDSVDGEEDSDDADDDSDDDSDDDDDASDSDDDM